MNASEDVIRYLHGIDTPTVSNAIEGLKVRNRASGFCDRTLKCLFPDLGIMCGHAVTAQVETMCLEPPVSRGGLNWSTWGRVKLYHFAVCSCT